MIWHIRLGKLSWCQAPYASRFDLMLAAREADTPLACSHLSKQTGEKMVKFLHECGIDNARLVAGACQHQDS